MQVFYRAPTRTDSRDFERRGQTRKNFVEFRFDFEGINVLRFLTYTAIERRANASNLAAPP